MSYVGLPPSGTPFCSAEYCPAGVRSKLPSGVNESLRKNEVSVSLAYRLAFFSKWPGFGDASIGITAGNGIDGAGEADLPRMPEAVEPNEDLREWLIVLGGFIGRACVVGVLGSDGRGESAAIADSVESCGRSPNSSGAGDDTLRLGRSIFWCFAMLDGPCSRVKLPSFVLKL